MRKLKILLEALPVDLVPPLTSLSTIWLSESVLAAADESQLPIKVGDWIFIVNNNSNLLANFVQCRFSGELFDSNDSRRKLSWTQLSLLNEQTSSSVDVFLPNPPIRLTTSIPIATEITFAPIPPSRFPFESRRYTTFELLPGMIPVEALYGMLLAVGQVFVADGIGVDPCQVCVQSINVNGTQLSVGSAALVNEGTVFKEGKPDDSMLSLVSKLVSVDSNVAAARAPAKVLVDALAWKQSVKALVGGLDDICDEIIDIVCRVLRPTNPNSTTYSGGPRGFLIHGPHGTGKSLLCKTIASASGLPVIYFDGAAAFRKGEGESEELIAHTFNEVKKQSPCIMVVDDLASVASSRRYLTGAIERRLVSHFIIELDRLLADRASTVFVFDVDLLRPRRFEVRFQLMTPSIAARKAIASIFLSRFQSPPEKAEEWSQLISQATEGSTGADIQSICAQALMHAASAQPSPKDDTIEVKTEHVERALDVAKISMATRISSNWKATTAHVGSDKTANPFSHLFGAEAIISELELMVVEPFKNPERFTSIGVAPPKGILLYGPSGVGKTELALAAAKASGSNVIAISGTDLQTKFVGESERALHNLFAKARAASPTVLIIDQLDSLARARGRDAASSDTSADRLLSALLVELDGVSQSNENAGRVCVLAVTNRPELLDPAILRPGRFDQVLFVPPPDRESRVVILAKLLNKVRPTLLTDTQIDTLASKTIGFSGADLVNLVREASLTAIRRAVAAQVADELPKGSEIPEVDVLWEDIEAGLKDSRGSVLNAPIYHPYNKTNAQIFFT